MVIHPLLFTWQFVLWATPLINTKTPCIRQGCLHVTLSEAIEGSWVTAHSCTLLTLALYRSKGFASCPSNFTVSTEWTGVWAGLRGCLDALKMRENFSLPIIDGWFLHHPAHSTAFMYNKQLLNYSRSPHYIENEHSFLVYKHPEPAQSHSNITLV
jgi:hypothetical protein